MRTVIVCLGVLGLVAILWMVVLAPADVQAPMPSRPLQPTPEGPTEPEPPVPVEVERVETGATRPVTADAPPEQTDAGRIAGRVSDQTGVPIAGATVGLWQRKPAGMFFGGGRGAPRVEATSEPDGTYALIPDTDGSIVLVASHASYAEEVTELELAAGEQLDGVDFQLLQGLSISGMVVNENEELLAGAEVTVSSAQMAGPNRSRFKRTSPTTPAGEFVIKGMDPGTFSVRASFTGHHGSTREQLQVEAGATDVRIVLQRGGIVRGVVVGPDHQPVADARVVAGPGHETAKLRDDLWFYPGGPRAGADSGADGAFELLGVPVGEVDLSASHEEFRASVAEQVVVSLESPVTEVVLVLRPGLSIRGRVVDGAGAGVPGASVLMSTTVRRDMGMSWSGFRDKTTTDEQGEFIATGLDENDTYQFEARKDGLATRAEDMAIEFRAGAEDVLLHTEPGATVRGSVKDGDGTGVACSVWMRQTDGAGHGAFRRPETAEDGAYEIISLTAGTYRLECKPPEGYIPPDAIELILVGGEVREGVDFVLESGGTISGLVIDDGDEPVPGAMLGCMQMRPGGAVHLPMVASGEDGTFSFTGVPEGDLQIYCHPPPGFPPRQQTVGEARTVRAGEHVTVRLERGITLTGTVVDELGAPVTEFSLTTWKSTDRAWNQKLPRGFSTSDGTFEMPGVPAEEERLDVTASGFATGRFPLSGLPARGTHDCGTLPLTRGATLSGVVQGADGEPLAAVKVTLAEMAGSPDRPRRGDTVGVTETKADGSFRFEHTGEGPHRLDAAFTGLTPASEGVVLPAAGELAGIVLRLARGGVIRGTVTRTDGTPWVGAAVSCSGRGMPSATRGPPAPHTTDSDGNYLFDALLAGTYVLRLEAGLVESAAGGMRWMNSLEKRLELAAGSELVCDFLGADSCRVLGTVEGWSGLPDSPADCHANGALLGIVHLSGDGGRVSAEIAPDGSFEMERVLPGSYELKVHDMVELEVEVPAAVQHDLRVQAPTARITGRVRRGDGASPEGTVVRAIRQGGAAGADAQTGSSDRGACALANGVFDLRYLEPGDYEVVASVTGVGASLPVTVTLAAGRQEAGVELVVEVGGSVIVNVTDGEGRPATGARLSCQDDSGRTLESTEVEAGAEPGTYRLTGVPPGTFRVWAGRGNLGNGHADGVAVSAGAETQASIVLGRGAVARISVDRAGASVTNVELELLLDGRPVIDNSSRWTRTRFGPGALPMFPSGDYVLRVIPAHGSPRETPVTLPAAGETVEVHVALD